MIKNGLRYIAMLVAVVLMAVGCGPKEEVERPVLSASAESVVADGVESVIFTVSYGGEDVSAKAQVWCKTSGEQLAAHEFKTTAEGDYEFYAVYNGLQSNSVAVSATEYVAPGPHVSRFERHVCLMDLTGTGCSFCPKGYRNIVLNVTNNFIYSGFVHVLGFHDANSKLNDVADPMAIDVTTQLLDDFKVTGTPWFIVDLRDGGSLTDNVGEMSEAIDRSTEEYGAHSDVAIKTTFNKDAQNCKVDVKVFAETTDDYRVAVYVVEDNIKSPQLDGSVVIEEYNHRHVVRQMLSGSYKGDSLGRLKAESEAQKSYEFAIGNGGWKVENLQIYAMVIDSTGTVNNVAVCDVNNGEVDYKYLAN
ncbi:MAG: Omp28-related outer membrane protein [Tidjanibacter sp.]|nr:Omp28-related outer membrane protein [Tidjanibacter sp.]